LGAYAQQTYPTTSNSQPMTHLLLDNPRDVSEERRFLDGFEVLYSDEKEKELRLPVSVLPAPKKFNVLVGPNNSGKSRLMRQIFSQKTRLLPDDAFSGKRIRALYNMKEHGLRLLSENQIDRSRGPLDADIEGLVKQLEKFFHEPIASTQQLPGLPDLRSGLLMGNYLELWLGSSLVQIAQRDRENVVSRLLYTLLDELQFSQDLSDFRPGINRGEGQERDFVANLFPVERIPFVAYCPPIRTNMRIVDNTDIPHRTPKEEGGGFISDCSAEPLASAFCQSFGWSPAAYSWMLGGSRSVVTGGRFYEQVDLSHKAHRAHRLAFQSGVSYVLNKLVGIDNAQLIASEFLNHVDSGNHSKIKHVRVATDTGDYSIHDLGDGVFACLIMLLPLLTAQSPGVFFIEEPETHLHPGLQREFVKALCDEEISKLKHKIYLTTHSPIILDALAERASGDLSIIQVEKAEGGLGKPSRHMIRPVSALTVETLEQLGATSNALLARSLILVEGPSDVRYVQALIELSWKHRAGRALPPVEGRDYAIVTYGGSLLGDLINRDGEEVDPKVIPALGHYVLVLADSDIGKERKHETMRSSFAPFGGRIRYITTEDAIEMENLFDAGVWRKVFPMARTRKWRTPKRSVDDSTFATVRLGSIAAYIFKDDGKELDRKNGGETIEPIEKTAAAKAFIDLVRRGEITWEGIGPRAQSFTEQIRDFLDYVLERSRAVLPFFCPAAAVARAAGYSKFTSAGTRPSRLPSRSSCSAPSGEPLRPVVATKRCLLVSPIRPPWLCLYSHGAPHSPALPSAPRRLPRQPFRAGRAL
jgi:AAA domain, putative AbiEii toxin, Type IV TA system